MLTEGENDDDVVVTARTNLRVREQSKPINTFSHKLRWGPDVHKPTTQKRQKGSLQKGFGMFAQQQQRTICTVTSETVGRICWKRMAGFCTVHVQRGLITGALRSSTGKMVTFCTFRGFFFQFSSREDASAKRTVECHAGACNWCWGWRMWVKGVSVLSKYLHMFIFLWHSLILCIALKDFQSEKRCEWDWRQLLLFWYADDEPEALYERLESKLNKKRVKEDYNNEEKHILLKYLNCKQSHKK